LSETESLSLELFQKLGSITKVAGKRSLKPSTISGHLAQAVKFGKISVKEVTGLEDEELAQIKKAFDDLTSQGVAPLGQVFERLGKKYDYGVLKCVRMDMGD
jgi:ATP-dependent DNA helicase RecQ